MEGLTEILEKVQKNELQLPLAAMKIAKLFNVKGWIEFEGNENLFNILAKLNCLCKFDDGTICKYNDKHPIAILTHFKNQFE